MRQQQALNVMLDGGSVFLTGPPGAGKTYVLNEFIHRSTRQGRHVAITASTGIAATHIGGVTIHSWSGLGIREELSSRDKDWLHANAVLVRRYTNTDILVIDEVSMLHGKRLDMVNAACKILRDNDAAFGGLQVILVGDLFQLPPVSRGGEVVDFVHTSAAWAELKPAICYLSEQYRQSSDSLLDVLEAMRRGEVEEWHVGVLQERLKIRVEAGRQITRLYAHNIDVDGINQRHLHALPSKSIVFMMETHGPARHVEPLMRSVLAPESLILKVDAEVMFVANNFAAGFVNGTRGRVVGFTDNAPLVELAGSGKTIRVEPHSWTVQEDGKRQAEVVQLPLRLAWAITIHKSQGMSLDAAEIDLGKSFTPGMGYVALSRVRSLDGVFLTGLNAMAMRLHPAIFEFDAVLREASFALSHITPDATDEVTPEEDTVHDTCLINATLLSRLKKWRIRRAQTDGIPPYVVAHDSLLEALSMRVPLDRQQLLAIPGIGARKLQLYGEELLQILHDSTRV